MHELDGYILKYSTLINSTVKTLRQCVKPALSYRGRQRDDVNEVILEFFLKAFCFQLMTLSFEQNISEQILAF